MNHQVPCSSGRLGAYLHAWPKPKYHIVAYTSQSSHQSPTHQMVHWLFYLHFPPEAARGALPRCHRHRAARQTPP